MLRERLQKLKIERAASIPAANRAARDREVRVTHDPVHVEEAACTQADHALAAGAAWIIEREQARFQVRDAEAADGACVSIRKDRDGGRGRVEIEQLRDA